MQTHDPPSKNLEGRDRRPPRIDDYMHMYDIVSDMDQWAPRRCVHSTRPTCTHRHTV